VETAPASSRTKSLLWAAVGAGILVRLALLFVRPLWADEIFTLNLARKSFAGILAALRVDSGPPLHYVLAHLLLAPSGPNPGPEDFLVRALSVAASLLHLPLFFRVTRLLGKPEAGLPAAAFFSVFPLAADYAAEGRAYALASLLVLYSLDRALALREEPRFGTAVLLAVTSAAAVLTHYLALLPLLGLATLFVTSGRGARKGFLVSAAGAALLLAGWAPVALKQPLASMAWSKGGAFRGAARHFFVNLVFGAQVPDPFLIVLLPLSLVVLATLLFVSRSGPFAVVAGALLTGLVLLSVAQALTGAVLLPERSALPFLPFVALLLGAAPAALGVPVGAAAAAWLIVRLPSLAATSPGETLASLLLPKAKEGKLVCAVELWGPELDYRFRRAGVFDRVVFFPQAIARHPGWYHESEVPEAAMRAEAMDLSVSRTRRPSLFVLPRGSRATEALIVALRPYRARLLFSNPLVDVAELP
jgi:hypothetical protein